jgi:cytosine/adenosine deaminase-related metal-dependent hydrolase
MDLKRLNGVVVTMGPDGRILRNGSVFIKGTDIVAVQDATATAPDGFGTAAVIDTGGTIFPGLMDLHNHLSYNALRLWKVPQKFGDRSQWPKLPEYHQLVTGPMSVLGHSIEPDILPSIVRYVEAKCLVAGVTTSQGIALASAGAITHYYKGVVRNVESPADPRLPGGASHIADVAASDWKKFDAEIKKSKRLLLHLAEGKDDAAHEHFLALKSGSQWAITPSLVGIHCAGLDGADFETVAAHGGSMIWSPLSNYLLYGATADVVAANAAKVPIGLGPDWSPTGSKNLLAELKVAHCASAILGKVFTDEEIVGMATSVAAKILNWDAHVGSIAANKLADLVVIAGKADAGKEHSALVNAREDDIALVMIGGVARFGQSTLMRKAGVAGGETLKVGGKDRVANFDDETSDPTIGKVTLAAATATLTKALDHLPDLQKKHALAPAAARPRVTLALLEQEHPEVDLRPHLPIGAKTTGLVEAERTAAAAAPLPLIALKLDPLTTVDDPDYKTTVLAEKNLPSGLVDRLKDLL